MKLLIASLIAVAAVACTPNPSDAAAQNTAPTGASSPQTKTASTGPKAAKPRTVVVKNAASSQGGSAGGSNAAKKVVIRKGAAAQAADGADEADDMDELHEEIFELANNGDFGEEINVMVAQGAAAGDLNSLSALRGQAVAVAGVPVEFDDNAAFLGVGAEPVSTQTAAQLPLKPGTGLVVTMVVKDSPAEKAGLKPNDVLARLGDQMLVNAGQLSVLIRANKPGDSINIAYLRGGKEQTAAVQLAGKKLPKLGPGGQRADAGFSGDVMMIAPDAQGQGFRAMRMPNVQTAQAEAFAEAARAHAAMAKDQARMVAEQARAQADQARAQAEEALAQGEEAAANARRTERFAAGRAMAPRASGDTQTQSEIMHYNDDATEIVWSQHNGKVHVKVQDLAADKTVYDADGAPDSAAMESFSDEVRASVQSFLEDRAKLRRTRSGNPYAAPTVPPVPPMQPAPPAPPSASVDSGEELFEADAPTT
jgi:hypothetical protein